jgi:5'-3' exonuclease
MNRPTSIALIDISYLFKKRWVTSDVGSPLAAAKATLFDLENLRRGVGHVIICRDGAPYKRCETFAEYKANRPPIEPEERHQRKWLFAELKRLGYNVAWSDGAEADDVIATLARIYGEWCSDVRIVGPDKDMGQCVTDNVRQFIPPVGDRDWEMRDKAGVMKKFGVAPADMPLFQALMGDKGDNVPGVKGIGEVMARTLINKHRTLEGIAEAWAADCAGGKPARVSMLLAEHWNELVMSLKLVTLDTNVMLDAEGLLVPNEPEPEQQRADVPFEGFMGNDTPLPPPVTEAVYEQAKETYEQRVSANDSAPASAAAAKDAELLEQEYDRERERHEEHDARERKAPARVTPPARPANVRPVQPPQTTALAKVEKNYGIVTDTLQPCDLQSAEIVCDLLLKGGLYPQFRNTAQVFTVIARGKELGIGMTQALANTHIIDGKPVSHADLLRALAEKDPNFDYLMPVEMSATKCVWEGKNKRHPRPVTFTYTIDEARAAGLCRQGNYGKPGNWEKRPQDMLNKTAASKLARLLWPGATMGLYCYEEMGYSEEELSQKEAA